MLKESNSSDEHEIPDQITPKKTKTKEPTKSTKDTHKPSSTNSNVSSDNEAELDETEVNFNMQFAKSIFIHHILFKGNLLFRDYFQ